MKNPNMGIFISTNLCVILPRKPAVWGFLRKNSLTFAEIKMLRACISRVVMLVILFLLCTGEIDVLAQQRRALPEGKKGVAGKRPSGDAKFTVHPEPRGKTGKTWRWSWYTYVSRVWFDQIVVARSYIGPISR